MGSASHGAPAGLRQALRQSLLAQRETFVVGQGFEAAGASLAGHLARVLSELEPESLGLYWPHRSEFNAVAAIVDAPLFAKLPVALPFARREPVDMHYRSWNRQLPTMLDECGIATSNGAPVTPDVVLVPCVGFTPSHYRLGYGGGYFDRWLAQHPGTVTVGVSWAVGAIDDDRFDPAPHDLPLTLIVTESGVV